ncbi:MAG: trypsin-like peptidase domain-containing protein [Erysipelotrichaceae bacterium]|nr:trypsin-like peptidase domain-containing protein [Erysipelotrichaceae bacterium]
MKINVKSLIILFLVALLGSGIGTFGVLSYYDRNVRNVTETQDNVILNEVEYTNIEKTDYTKAIEKAYNTVVEISCKVETSMGGGYFIFGGGTTTSTSTGSGVIFSSDGYIVTNEHVIDGLTDENTIQVKLYTGEVVGARLVGYDARTDLAVLKIDKENLPFALFVDSDQLMLGQDVIAIGNPLGLGISCSNGIVSALEKEIYINNVYMSVIQTNAAVNEGNSGGGLFDINGNLIGIVNAKKSSSMTTTVEGMGYAIPANTVVRVVDELIQNGYVKDRAALGVRVYTSSSYYSSKGVLISEVIEGGSADAAGIQANDAIIAIDDHAIETYADLSKVLDGKAVGDKVDVTILRNDEELHFEVTLQASSR